MTDLTIHLTGEVRESNFEEWKHSLVERIRAVEVDGELREDEDFKAANDSIRQFRDAEQTLKSAKQAALEQAADINRLFDAVDAVAEETRQARLALERRIRMRRHEIKQGALQAGIEENAAVLDALPAEQRALFQDRAALLSLSSDELGATIDRRIEVWKALEGRAHVDAGEPSRGDGERPPRSFEQGAGAATSPTSDGGTGVPSDASDDDLPFDVDADEGADTPRRWYITIELMATKAKADKLFGRVRDRWKSDAAVSEVSMRRVEAGDRSTRRLPATSSESSG